MSASTRGLGLVAKQVFETHDFRTAGGAVLPKVRIGYETYGQLNATRDNAILVAHYFSGTSHCAGRYQESDVEAGYWDTIIGPGKAIDTDRYFVISADTLCNLNTGDPNVITTGPTSIDPRTGKPYGMTFPLITIGDMVETQRLLLESLGVHKLYAVAGPSMGSLQALEWSVRYPDRVPRVIAVISGGLDSDPYLIATLNTWMAPILADPAWNNGDYHEQVTLPSRGLTQALKLVTHNALHDGWANRTFERRPHKKSQDPAAAFANPFAIEVALEETARTRAQIADANSFLYLAKAVQLYSIRERATQMKAEILMIPAQSDLLLFPRYAKRGADELRDLGHKVKWFELEGDGGHLDGLHAIDRAGSVIQAFLVESSQA